MLQQKIKRANYVTYIWKHASEHFILELDPCNHGWSLVNDEFTVNWFEGLQIPSDIGDTIDPVMFEEDGDEDRDKELIVASSDDDSERYI